MDLTYKEKRFTSDTIAIYDADATAIKLVQVGDLPFTNNAGTITSVTGRYWFNRWR